MAGQVASAEGGSMEGVVVSAKKAGSTITTISLISDADGKFSFPAGKLEPGQYALELVGHQPGHEAGRAAGAGTPPPLSAAWSDKSAPAQCCRRSGPQATRPGLSEATCEPPCPGLEATRNKNPLQKKLRC